MNHDAIIIIGVVLTLALDRHNPSLVVEGRAPITVQYVQYATALKNWAATNFSLEV